MASKGKDQPKKAPKKKNGYEMPKPLKSGDVLTDTQKNQWKIGVSIGVGGFGEIYSACKVGSNIKKLDDYPFVVKIEPKENGPLFVEMHFYMRNAKHEDVEAFKKDRKLKTLGMPEFVAQGSHEIQEMKHRFIVLPRFGRDVSKIFSEQNYKFPLHTVYRLGYQILNVLEYIHNREYVHGDIKGSNILLGFGKGGDENVFLLDFGLACHYNTKDFKPDPKKMHNGTIEYTSRDAHLGVPTMRGDIEILAYNLIEWSGAKLPWVEKKLLAKPVDVQKSKEEFMKSFDKSLKSAYGNEAVPGQIAAFFKYLGAMKDDTKPDFAKLRGMFEAGIKELSQKNVGPLEFTGSKASATAPANKKKEKVPAVKPIAEAKNGEPSTKAAAKPAAAGKRNQAAKNYVDAVSDSEDDMLPSKAKSKPAPAKKAPVKKPEPEKEETRPPKRVREATKKVVIDSESSDDEDSPRSTSPQKKPRARTSPRSTSKENEEKLNVSPPQKKNKSSKNDDEAKQAKGVITMKSKTSSKGNKKTIQLNFNLDVSLDSDLVVVVNRKDKKKKTEEPATVDKDDDEVPNSDDDLQVKVNRAGVYKGKHAKAK